MSGFTFPPPPPPPPKPSQPTNDQVTAQDGFRGRGRGRGRGSFRGGLTPRGRGQSSWRGGRPAGGETRSLDSDTRRGNGAQYESHLDHQVLPPGSYVNPNFHTPSGSPSTSSFRQNGYRPPQHLDEISDQQLQTSPTPARTVAGHKRKLEALREPQQPRPKKPGPKTAPSVPSFGAPILPQKVASSTHTSGTIAADNPKQKVVGRSLGLIPTSNDQQYSASEDEDDDDEDGDIDEEAMHAELGNKLTFEHNGVMMALKSQADLVAWKKARRKNWPTRARMAEKDGERRRVGEERKRLLAGAASLQQTTKRWEAKPNKKLNGSARADLSGGAASRDESREVVQDIGVRVEDEREIDRARKELTDQTNRLDELRRKVAESEARNRKAKAQMARTVETNVTFEPSASVVNAQTSATTVEPDAESAEETNAADVEEVTSESSSDVSSVSSSEMSSDSSSEADSDDGPPEEVASKPTEAEPTGPQRPICRYFAASGYCRDGEYCQLKHERTPQLRFSRSNPQQQAAQREQRPAPETATERKTIFQRLLEQEQNEEDRLALQVIKHLGKVGLFSEVACVNET